MAIYIAVPLTQTISALDDAITNSIQVSDRYQLQSDRGWLIKFDGTSVELSVVG